MKTKLRMRLKYSKLAVSRNWCLFRGAEKPIGGDVTHRTGPAPVQAPSQADRATPPRPDVRSPPQPVQTRQPMPMPQPSSQDKTDTEDTMSNLRKTFAGIFGDM